MVEQASQALREAGVDEQIGTVLADGSYWNSAGPGPEPAALLALRSGTVSKYRTSSIEAP